MKKMFVAVVLCMALLSSFTLSASATFDSSDSTMLSNIYTQLTAIRDQLGYPQGGFSSLRAVVNSMNSYLASIASGSSSDYSTVLSNIKSNSDSLVSYIKLIEGDTNNISARSTDLLYKLQDVYLRQGQMQLAITDHIDLASTQNHIDLTSFASQNHSDFNFLFDSVFDPVPSGLSSSQSGSYRYPIFLDSDDTAYYGSFGTFILFALNNLTNDRASFAGGPTLFHIVHQLQQVLASDDDLQLKQDNKSNEDAATDAFVNGSSSKTSLGTGDIGNLKDVGGTFNDLTSLNGQSSVTSFLNGLSSADGTGQGWFSEATRASLDAVSTPVTTTNLVRKTWRGEKSLTYSISADTSVNVVASPAPARAPAADPDPYNMSGFEDNYNWLWGDAS